MLARPRWRTLRSSRSRVLSSCSFSASSTRCLYLRTTVSQVHSASQTGARAAKARHSRACLGPAVHLDPDSPQSVLADAVRSRGAIPSSASPHRSAAPGLDDLRSRRAGPHGCSGANRARRPLLTTAAAGAALRRLSLAATAAPHAKLGLQAGPGSVWPLRRWRRRCSGQHRHRLPRSGCVHRRLLSLQELRHLLVQMLPTNEWQGHCLTSVRPATFASCMLTS